ncbi:YlxR family protein [Conexibacter sp. CPCC 206217]|uniref:YlxR family protein n=1 Tax=Conexibacter sp. CPCC 206217 TaxID=3064574 RepID=UPI00351C20BC
MTGHEPLRRCVGCGRTAPRSSLLRYVVIDGALVADSAGQLPGRGAYTCRARDCFDAARSRGGFNRAFRRAVRVPSTVPAELDPSENVHLDTA